MKKKIAVLMGGYSDEVEISMLSGQAVMKHIDRSRFLPTAVHVLSDRWSARDADGAYEMDRGDFSFQKNGEKQGFDAVFIAVHGRPGEDGTLQAYFDLLGMPYTGCSMQGAALTFNKYCCNRVLHTFGVPIPQSLLLNSRSRYSVDDITARLELPLFVKPNKGGSSLGMAKVGEKAALPQAIAAAFARDDEVILESAIEGVEVSVGVLQYRGKTRILPLTELVYADVFDYAAKYKGQSQEITPARIDRVLEEAVKRLALTVYRALNLKGFSRSEYVIKRGVPHLLDVNTVPGFTEQSIFPQQLNACDISLGAFITAELERILSP
ncbi:MAG: D-alanine--D-alanine ligase [Flavobacteriales bacterium]